MSQPHSATTWPPTAEESISTTDTDTDTDSESESDIDTESDTGIDTDTGIDIDADATDAFADLPLPSAEIDDVLAAVRAAGHVVTQEEALIARDICRAADPEPFISGKSPTGLAAAALYAAAQLEAVRKGEPYANQPGPSERDVLTQREISNAVAVSEVAVRNTYKHLASLWAAKADANLSVALPDAYETLIGTWRATIDDADDPAEAV
ncbi:MAG: hypothetical protein ACOCR0_02415 [Haloferacaceae archaeon]